MEEVEIESRERVEEGRGAQAGSRANFRLTDRDVEILGFLLDQKFASLEQLYFRFFDARKAVSEPLPPNLHVTRQRLQVLKRAGLVTSQRVFSEPRSLYLLSPFGYQIFAGGGRTTPSRLPLGRSIFGTTNTIRRSTTAGSRSNGRGKSCVGCRSDGSECRALKASTRGMNCPGSSCRMVFSSPRKGADRLRDRNNAAKEKPL